MAPYLKKGTQVYVEGTPDIRTYTTNDGRNGASLQLRVFSVQLLGTGNRQDAATPSQPFSTAIPSANEISEPVDDLPF